MTTAKYVLGLVLGLLIWQLFFPGSTPAYIWDRQTVDQYGDQGVDNSIALDMENQPHVSYREIDWFNMTDYLKYASWDGIAWHVEYVDQTGDVGFASSLAIDSSNQPSIAYRDINNSLRYAKKDGYGWHHTIVDNQGTGADPSLVLDKSDNPHISYYRPYSECIFNTKTQRYEWILRADLRYAFWDGQNWLLQTVEQGGRVGEGNSLALDSKGHPHIAYWAIGVGLKYATWDGATWQFKIVDSQIPVINTYKHAFSIAVDSADRPCISYMGEGYSLKYTTWDGNSWQPQVVKANAGSYELPNSLALDNTDKPHILFRDYVTNSLIYAVWDGNAWQLDTVDSGNVPGLSNSLKLDDNNQPNISYYVAISGEGGGALYYAKFGSARTVTASPAGGLFDVEQKVKLSTSVPWDVIYYTTDGSTPTKNSTAYYQNSLFPILIAADRTTVLKFFAVDNMGNEGQVQTEIYTIDTTTPIYLLTVNNIGSGSGGVLVNNEMLSWFDFAATAKFKSGAMVTLTPQADFGSVFGGWSGACTGTGPCQLTMGTSKNATAAYKALQAADGFVAVATGAYHSLVLNSEGAVLAWGLNNSGQLGDGTTTQKTIPARVPSLLGVSAIAAGLNHSLAIKDDSTVVAWGLNANSQLGDGTTIQRDIPTPVALLSGIKAISAGAWHSLALKNDGTVYAWGLNGNGQLGDGTTTQRNMPIQVPGLSGIVAIAAGSYHSLALKDDGTMFAWGYNGYGRLGDGTTTQRIIPTSVSGLSGVKAIAAGAHHSLALKDDGTVMAWGLNTNSQLGVAFTPYELLPHPVPNLSGITSITAGGLHSLAIGNNGSVYAWGDNSDGQLGDGTTTLRSFPALVPKLAGVTSIAAGNYYSMAIKNDGMVVAWGQNSFGQLGDWTTIARTSPVQVKFTIGPFTVNVEGPINNGAVSCTSPVIYNKDSICTIIPNPGYLVKTFLVNGVDRLAEASETSVTISKIQSDQLINVSFAPSATLTLTFAGTGGGSVHGDMTCSNGEICTPVIFAENTVITLIPTPDTNSLFDGWSDSCTVNDNNCSVIMAGSKAVTATFNAAPPLRILGGATYSLLSSAYAAATNNAVIQARAILFNDGDLILNRAVSIFVMGGYDTAFNLNQGDTLVKGKLMVRNGTVRVDGLVLR